MTPELVVSIMSSLSKILFKLVSKDNEQINLAGNELIDLIRIQTNDKLVQERVERTFRSLSDRITQEVLELFEDNNSELSIEQKNNVWEAVNDLLKNPTINIDVLIKYQLDPDKLFYSIKKSSNQSILFNKLSSNEKNIVDNILYDYCNYSVDLASKLPQFSERTFKEILKNGAKIFEALDEISEQIKSINKALLNADGTHKKFESDYRNNVVRKLNNLRLFGIDVKDDITKYPLDVAYISLALKDSDSKHGHSYIQPYNILSDNNICFIVGDAGSGKTTLLQWLAIELAKNNQKLLTGDWVGRLPIFIKLRNYTESKLPQLNELLEGISPVLSNKVNIDWINEVLEKRGVLLVDGLDELTNEKRVEAISWITDFSKNYKDLKVIISSRPKVTDEYDVREFLNENEVALFEIMPMKKEQINIFVKNWHKAVKYNFSKSDFDAIDRYERKLLDELKDSKTIRSLATNPLLNAVICALSYGRETKLPNNKVELYDECIKLLVEKREKERKIIHETNINLSYNIKIKFLQSIAYWMMRNKVVEVELDRLEKKAKSIFNNFIFESDLTELAIVEYFINRTSIIREPSKNVVDFTHKSFQEFLAAKAIIDEDDIEILVDNALDNFWGETLSLACQLGSKKFRNKIINELIDHSKGKKEERSYLILIFDCLTNAIEIDDDLSNKYSNIIINQLGLPQSSNEVKSYSLLGNYTVNLLSQIPPNNKRELGFYIETLINVGTRKSLINLSKIENLRHLGYDYLKILKASPKFDKYDFNKYLAPNGDRISILHAEEVIFLNNWNQYMEVAFSIPLNFSDFLSEKKIVSVEKISFCEEALRSFSLIKKFPNVKEIEIKKLNQHFFPQEKNQRENGSDYFYHKIDWEFLADQKIEKIDIHRFNILSWQTDDRNPLKGIEKIKTLKLLRIRSADIPSKNLHNLLNKLKIKQNTEVVIDLI